MGAGPRRPSPEAPPFGHLLDAALLRSSLRLARPRPRLGDRGPSDLTGWAASYTPPRAVHLARVPELADGPDLGSGVRKGVGVRVPPLAPASADYLGSTTILPRVWPEATSVNAW